MVIKAHFKMIQTTPPVLVFDAKKIEKKLRLADGLFQMAYEIKRFQLKQKFPTMSEQEINHRAYALIEKGCR